MNYYEEIKQELINNEVYKRVKDYSKNKSDLNTYYNVGKLLVEAQGGEERAKYGNKLIKEYSVKLTNELGRGYSTTNLKNMRSFYLVSKSQAMTDQLSWSHYCELLLVKDKNAMNYYINISINQNLTYRQLHKKIKNKEYERLPDKTKIKLNSNENLKLSDMVKNPLLIKNKYGENNVSEKMLHNLILEDISSFMKELGEGFSYIDSEYKIKIGDRYNYIDFLLYNIKYKCYVVIELKVTKMKKEYIGQVTFYMNYIDKNVKNYDDKNTIGIVICKKENRFVIEYASDERIFQREYKII